MADAQNKVFYRLPNKPVTRGGGFSQFPADIGQFYCTITFSGRSGVGMIKLPIPRKVNEVQTVVWEQTSITSAAFSAFGSQGLETGINMAGFGVGLRMNPFLIMMFKQPNFKEYTFNWQLAPNNRQESQAISNIIRTFKRTMSPTKELMGTAYGYPSLATVKFQPNEQFLFRTKPAAIMAVQSDYTGAGQPSFFDNGAPTVVNLAVSFRETSLWTAEEF
jgi:hypothetical protein